ncbi:MAG: hypothetical protein H3C31_02940 [Brumimicrobium sp.]|nr:hypothetical protein [Brumimicrobium sp.]
MKTKITSTNKAKMRNPIIQFFKYIWLSLKIMFIVTKGHGGTRKIEQ